MITQNNLIEKRNSHLETDISNNSNEMLSNLESNIGKNHGGLILKKNSKNMKNENLNSKEKFITTNNAKNKFDILKNQNILKDNFFSQFKSKSNKNFELVPLTWDCFVEKKIKFSSEKIPIKKTISETLFINNNQNCGFSPIKKESFVKFKRENIPNKKRFLINEDFKKKRSFSSNDEFKKSKQEEEVSIIERFKKISKRRFIKNTKIDNLKNKSIKKPIAINFETKEKDFTSKLTKTIKNILHEIKIVKKTSQNLKFSKNFQNLLKILKKIFKNQPITIEMINNLNKNEKIILKSLLERKYHINLNIDSPSINLKEKITNIMSLNSLKRPEENYKFIFKRCLKSMKNEMKSLFQKKIKKKDFEKIFYEFYFKEISQKESIPLEHFFHPKNSKAVKKLNYITPKTINSYYINNITKSKEFMKKFLGYLQNKLLIDYEKLIDFKFESLIFKWSEEFEACSDDGIVVGRICGYVKGNKKCKLPWNFKEIEEAIKVVRNLLE